MDKDMYNSLDEEYKKPYGAVKVGTEVSFCIHIDKLSDVKDAKLVIFPIDHWEEREEVDLKLSKFNNSKNFYSCNFTPLKEEVYYYYFKMFINGEYKELRRGQASYGVFGKEDNECFQLTSYTKDISVPDFMKGAIFYQIFPDRFCKSNEIKNCNFNDRKIHSDWYENPDYMPVDGKILNNDYFGGDLKGITQKLDYIKSLGVNIIYLNPIFEAHSNHRYDTANYLKIDPLLGGIDDFKKLCSEANRRDIKIILDGVFNHTGSDSIYFNKNNRYDSVGAYNSYDSIYREWYNFYLYPDKYDSWWGFETLPKLNQNCDASLKYIEKVVKSWIDNGASGFRFDVVDEINNERFYRISRAVKESKATTIGEVWEDVSVKEAYGERKNYFTKNTLDSAMNYVFKDALFEFFETKNSEVLLDKILRIVENYPKENLDALMNIISSHDIERALTRLAKGPCDNKDRFWQASNDYLDPSTYEYGKSQLKLLSTMQYFLPGNPCLYYGDEAGVYGFKDPFNRKTYPWGREDTDLIEFYKTIGNIRREEAYLKDARFVPILFNNSTCVFARESLDKKDSLFVGVNLSKNTLDLDFLKPNKILYSMDDNDTKLAPNKALVLKK